MQTITKGKYGNFTLETRDEKGELTCAPVAFKFGTQKQQTAAAKLTGIEVNELARLVDVANRDGSATVTKAAPIGPPPYRVRIGPDATPHLTFDAALADAVLCGTPETYIEWPGYDGTAALDADFHRGERPPVASILATAAILTPRPSAWWVTKSGGLRGIYHTGRLDAIDLAAAAALVVAGRHPEASIELKRVTRVPPGEYTLQTQTDDTPSLRGLCGIVSADTGAFAEWLTDRGYTVGQRLPHTECPLNPSPRAAHNSNPVVIMSDGVYCHVCARQYVPRGNAANSLFGVCVKQLTHFEHARPFVRAAVPSAILDDAAVYRAALRDTHGRSDPRIPGVFDARHDLIRIGGYWVDGQGETITFARGDARLAALPASQYVEGGEVKVSPTAVSWLTHTGDLTKHGYPAVVPVWGIQLSAFNPSDTIHRLFQARRYTGKEPRYVPAGVRMPEVEAWGTLERYFPGLNQPAVRLLLVAKGCAEIGAGLPPFLFFSGPTSAGKTATVQIVAAMLGDQYSTVTYDKEPSRLADGIRNAKATGTFALFDEYLKGAARTGIGPAAALETLLNFTPDARFHKLYIGQAPLGPLPVCIWADTTLPQEVIEHGQIARRVVPVRFTSRVDWQASMEAAGLYNPYDLRDVGELRTAADAILSYVIDDYFCGPPPRFQHVAGAMGFGLMEQTIDVQAARRDRIGRLFDAVCKAPELSDGERRKYGGQGWKVVNVDGGSELDAAWNAVANRPDYWDSRIVRESDLQKTLGLSRPADLDVQRHGDRRSFAIRFRGGDAINGQLRLEPVAAGVDGRRDAERREPESDWWKSIPATFHNATTERCISDGE